jgi:phage tail-like protein
MATSEINRPPVSFAFQLSFSSTAGSDSTTFLELSGIDMEMDTEGEVDSGGENRFKHRLPGVAKYNNLVLKRGLVSKDAVLAKWILDTLEPGLNTAITPKTITVSLLDQSGEVMMSWDFINAYPVKWEVADLKSNDNELAIETLELAYNYFKRN